LRGIAHCARCGSGLYSRRFAVGRTYLCGAVREARGTCDLPRIPADHVEAHVLRHLDVFNIDLQDWLAERAAEHRSERDAFAAEVERQRAELAKLARRAERAHGVYQQLLDDGDDLAATALREAQRMEADRDDHARAIADAEQRLTNWSADPDLDAALDAYNRIADLIAGRIGQAKGIAALNVAMRDLLDGCDIDVLSDEVSIRFQLSPHHFHGLVVMLTEPAPSLLPPWKLDGTAEGMRELLRNRVDRHGNEPNTGTQTFVCRPKQPSADDPRCARCQLPGGATNAAATAWHPTAVAAGCGPNTLALRSSERPTREFRGVRSNERKEECAAGARHDRCSARMHG